MKNPIRATVAIVVTYHGWTNHKPSRYAVLIRDYPTKFYCSQSGDPAAPADSEFMPQWCAEKRIAELGLNWKIVAHGYAPDGAHVFVTGK